jgi:ribosomal protein S3AE
MAQKQKKQKPQKVMKQKVKSRKVVKKSFYEVAAPLTSTKILLYAPSKEDLEGKRVKLDLTKILRGKSLELKLKVILEKDKLLGSPESIELIPSYIRRVMRKGTDYCEDSFDIETRDAKVRVKPFLITRKRVSRAVLKALREEAKKFLTTYVKTRTAEELFSEIMTNKIQKQLSLKLKKIYPLALCEIRSFSILKSKK